MVGPAWHLRPRLMGVGPSRIPALTLVLLWLRVGRVRHLHHPPYRSRSVGWWPVPPGRRPPHSGRPASVWCGGRIPRTPSYEDGGRGTTLKGSPRELPARLRAGSPGERLTRWAGKGAERPADQGSQVFAGPLADLGTDQPARPTRSAKDRPAGIAPAAISAGARAGPHKPIGLWTMGDPP